MTGLLAGDLAAKELGDDQFNKVIAELSVERPFADTNCFLEAPPEGYTFLGDGLKYTSCGPTVAFGVELPIIDPELAAILEKFFFDPDDIEQGILRSPAYRAWLDDAIGAIFENAAPSTNMRYLSPITHPAEVRRFAKAFGTIVGMKLAEGWGQTFAPSTQLYSDLHEFIQAIVYDSFLRPFIPIFFGLDETQQENIVVSYLRFMARLRNFYYDGHEEVDGVEDMRWLSEETDLSVICISPPDACFPHDRIISEGGGIEWMRAFPNIFFGEIRNDDDRHLAIGVYIDQLRMRTAEIMDLRLHEEAQETLNTLIELYNQEVPGIFCGYPSGNLIAKYRPVEDDVILKDNYCLRYYPNFVFALLHEGLHRVHARRFQLVRYFKNRLVSCPVNIFTKSIDFL